MDAARWSRLNDLVADALAMPPADRPAFLAAEAPDDGLRDEAAALVAAADAADAAGALDSPFHEPPLPGPIGPWRPTARIGSGGMGVVYAAERTDDSFRQRAALKLVRPGFGPDFAARFVRERALLAGLDHPGIARLLDGGLTPDGLPYLAVELVDGTPITGWAADRDLGLRARIDLFLQACEAVTHAHRHLVVHRDLKPAHILVEEDDAGRGRVKLLDFGIATLLDGTDGGLTRTGPSPLTPQYAAPEQLAGTPVTTATDVYALGLVLYELLTGRRPYDLRGRTASETERIVSETTVAPPSTAGVPAVDARALRGDLDTIVLRAVAKEPERRYPSAEALADDLRRHLDGLPVRARPDTVRYRAQTFVRRHRVGVAAAAAVLGALVGGAGLAVWQAREAQVARQRAEARFEVAREAARAMIYEVHDAVAGIPGATPARGVIVARALDYLDRLAADSGDDPALRVDLAGAYLRIGNVQGGPTNNHLGRPDDAVASYRRGLALLDALPPALPDSLAAAAAETEGQLWDKWGVVVAHQESGAASLPYSARAIAAQQEARRRAPGAPGPVESLATAHVNRGDFLGHPYFPNAGLPDSALAAYARVRTIIEEIPERERSLYALRLLGIASEREGNLHRALGRLDAAVAPTRRALALRQQIAARPDANADALRDVGVSHESLGRLATERGRLGEALRELRRALAVYQSLADADPRSRNAQQTLAIGHLHLAELYGDPAAPNLGRRADARRHARRAHALLRTLTEDDPTNLQLRDLAAGAEALIGRIG